MEQRGEKEAHVVLTQQRFLHKVEITINAWDHSLVGIATDGDISVAAHEAFDRLEKQLLKLRARWRDTRRVRDKEADGEKASASLQAVAPVAASSRKAKPARVASTVKNSAGAKKAPRKQVFRVNPSDGKPMTLEEAMLEMETAQDYLVYRDARKRTASRFSCAVPTAISILSRASVRRENVRRPVCGARSQRAVFTLV